MRFKYLDLPTVPEHLLIKSVEEISGLENIFKLKDYPYYKQYIIPNLELTQYIENIFNCQCFCTYQVIKNGIAIHKDFGRNECYNYLLETGGPDAALDIYDESKILIESIKIPKHKWHWINVQNFHGVSGLINTRMAISITT